MTERRSRDRPSVVTLQTFGDKTQQQKWCWVRFFGNVFVYLLIWRVRSAVKVIQLWAPCLGLIELKLARPAGGMSQTRLQPPGRKREDVLRTARRPFAQGCVPWPGDPWPQEGVAQTGGSSIPLAGRFYSCAPFGVTFSGWRVMSIFCDSMGSSDWAEGPWSPYGQGGRLPEEYPPDGT